MNYRSHQNRTVRDIMRQNRFAKSDDMVLDTANDAWLDSEGRVSDRYVPGHFIGDVGHLHGAARVSAALAIVSRHRSAA